MNHNVGIHFFLSFTYLWPLPLQWTLYEELIYYPYIKSKWNYICYLQWNTVPVPQNVWMHLSLIKKQKIWSQVDWSSQCSVLIRIWSIISTISRQQTQFVIWKASLKSQDSSTWQSIALISRLITCWGHKNKHKNLIEVSIMPWIKKRYWLFSAKTLGFMTNFRIPFHLSCQYSAWKIYSLELFILKGRHKCYVNNSRFFWFFFKAGKIMQYFQTRYFDFKDGEPAVNIVCLYWFYRICMLGLYFKQAFNNLVSVHRPRNCSISKQSLQHYNVLNCLAILLYHNNGSWSCCWLDWSGNTQSKKTILCSSYLLLNSPRVRVYLSTWEQHLMKQQFIEDHGI